MSSGTVCSSPAADGGDCPPDARPFQPDCADGHSAAADCRRARRAIVNALTRNRAPFGALWLGRKQVSDAQSLRHNRWHATATAAFDSQLPYFSRLPSERLKG